MIVIAETLKVCTLLQGVYHILQIEIVDCNFEMFREIIIAFARALALGEQSGINSGQRLSVIEKTDLLSFFGILSFKVSPPPH